MEVKVKAKGKDISPDGDGGLMKEIIREGMSEEGPLFDDEVLIDYVGIELDGKVFIDSRDEKEKCRFSLGRGEVIKGWEIAVGTMKRGEIAQFVCSPKYGYGFKGEKKYQSATNVIFQIELIDFFGKDMSECGDGSVIRRILRQGEGRQSPNEDSTVEIDLKGICEGKVFDERSIEMIVGLTFIENVPKGVDEAVRKMIRGEECQLTLQGAALEGLDKFCLPKDGSIKYEITLKKFQRIEDEGSLSEKDKFDQSDLLKHRGDHLVKDGHYQLAAKRYKRVANLLSSITLKDRNDRIKAQQLKIAAQANLSLCYFKLGDYLQCKTHCDAALTLNANNEKCLFRRGQAQINFKNFEQAIKDFESVLKINPSNVAAKQQIDLCYQRIKQQKCKEKQTYQSFFNDPSKSSLFQIDDQFEQAKQNLQENNSLRALGLKPVSLESLGITPPKTN